MLAGASRGAIRLQLELPVWQTWKTWSCPSRMPWKPCFHAGQRGSFRSRRQQPNKHRAKKLIPQHCPGHLLFILDFVSLSGFLCLSLCVSPVLKCLVRKIVNHLDSRPSQLIFLPPPHFLCTHTPLPRQGAVWFGAKSLGFGFGVTRLGSWLGYF